MQAVSCYTCFTIITAYFKHLLQTNFVYLKYQDAFAIVNTVTTVDNLYCQRVLSQCFLIVSQNNSWLCLPQMSECFLISIPYRSGISLLRGRTFKRVFLLPFAFFTTFNCVERICLMQILKAQNRAPHELRSDG